MDFSPASDFASRLDARDPLAGYRSRFAIPDPDLVYLDGNSLGRLTLAAAERLRQAVEDQWGRELIRGYNQDWWQAPGRIGEKIAPLIGAAPGQVIASDTVSINLFKLAAAALELRPGRTKIITDTLNFPSDLYILQGLVRLLSRSQGEGRGGQHAILRIGSRDGDVTPDLDALAAALDAQTALVTLSHVTFKSGYLYDMAAITELAHRSGALVIWDLSHAVGAVTIELDTCNADFAVGCTYKYLNGGPGAPAFLYVREALQEQVVSPIWGWWGQQKPFAFGLDYVPAPGVTRFLSGSQPIMSLLAMETALAPLLEAGMPALRTKSLMLSEYLISLADTLLAPLGFSLGSPRDPARRGSHVSLRHPEGYRINRALIEELNLIPDFREPDNLRLGLTPLYTSFSEVWEGIDRIRRAVEEKRYEKYSPDKLTVT
ncbi:MAG: kynureninase [Anaerolineales bacterium]|nr:kynureninase [Anaerolineales bacterium]